MATEASLADEIRAMKEDLAFIKSHMVDREEIMTAEEYAKHQAAMREYREGKSKTLQEIQQAMRRVRR